MVRNPKKNPDDFSQENYVNPKEKKELLMRQLDIVLQEQTILRKRVYTAKEASALRKKNDPEIALFQTQIEMDLIELDELIAEEHRLKTDIENLK